MMNILEGVASAGNEGGRSRTSTTQDEEEEPSSLLAIHAYTPPSDASTPEIVNLKSSYNAEAL